MQGSQLKFSLLYAFGIFALGFVLGTIRTLVLVPRIGALAGVAGDQRDGESDRKAAQGSARAAGGGVA